LVKAFGTCLRAKPMGSRVRLKHGWLTGSIISWKGHFGWIRPDVPINHPEAVKHANKIYVSRSDVASWEDLEPGTRVTFTAYADGEGLGAEAVYVLEEEEAPAPLQSFAEVPGMQSQPPPPPPHPRNMAFQASQIAGPPAYPPPTASGAKGGQSAGQWWKRLTGDCCPISLTPLEELTHEPFGLLGVADAAQSLQFEGVWGCTACNIALGHQHVAHSVHWFDGMFLASFLVSSGQLIDPVNRRPLTRGECVALDAYLTAHGLPAVHVADSFDLAKAVTGQQSGGDSVDAQRMSMLEREAASMLRSLFDFRSAAGAQPPPPPPRSAGQSGGGGPRPPRAGHPADGGGSGSQIETAPKSRLRSCVQRTVHTEGSLTVVDDGEFDEEYEEVDEVGPSGAMGSEPTPAEALALSRGKPTARPKVARSRPQPQPARTSGQGRANNEKPVCGGGKAAQVTFAVTGGRKGTTHSSSSASAAARPDQDTADRTKAVFDAWIPDWASWELHSRLLEELKAVEAALPGKCQVLTPDVLAHLEDCVQTHGLSQQLDPLRLEIELDLDLCRESRAVVVEFAIPPYYPMHAATVALRLAANTKGDIEAVLDRLVRRLREEVLLGHEGEEQLLLVTEWLHENGPQEYIRPSRGVGAVEGRASQQGAPGGSSSPAPVVKTKTAKESKEDKRERVEQAKKERLMSKYTEKWDVCYAFSKHGHCKDKNCSWRHDKATSESKGKNADSTTGGQRGNASVTMSKAESQGKSKSGKKC